MTTRLARTNVDAALNASAEAEVTVRPLQEKDVTAADEMAYAALSEVGEQFGFAMGERDPASIARAESRIRHIAANDPEGSFVAEQNGEVVGVGLATKRGSLWFLSLLAVRSGLQGGGVGKRIIDATLEYAEGCASAMICASPDPKALRRYGRAGFALHAGYEAAGVVDRTELPKDLGVRDGDWDRDADLVEELITHRRGEPYGPDLGWCRSQGMQLFVRDGASADDRAVLLTRDGHLGTLAAASVQAATRVLWEGLAQAKGEVTIGYLLGNQQWAIDVALSAKLPLKLTDTLCTRGEIGPPTPYLPSGLWG